MKNQTATSVGSSAVVRIIFFMTEHQLYTEKQTAETLLNNSHVADIEGWWQAWARNGHREYLHIRIDRDKQVYVVEAVGQELRHSEELWRYKDGWLFLRA